MASSLHGAPACVRDSVRLADEVLPIDPAGVIYGDWAAHRLIEPDNDPPLWCVVHVPTWRGLCLGYLTESEACRVAIVLAREMPAPIAQPSHEDQWLALSLCAEAIS